MIARARQIKSKNLQSMLDEGFEDTGKNYEGYPIYSNGQEAIIYDPDNDHQILGFKKLPDGSYEITRGGDKT